MRRMDAGERKSMKETIETCGQAMRIALNRKYS
jgi:hypothetical protein